MGSEFGRYEVEDELNYCGSLVSEPLQAARKAISEQAGMALVPESLQI